MQESDSIPEIHEWITRHKTHKSVLGWPWLGLGY